MPSPSSPTNLAAVILSKSKPGITMWNRLEGRPRTEAFDRALRAEVRDPLWMLTRQWQMGEFRGDDAGSPISVKVRVETTRLRKYQAASGPVGAVQRRGPARGARGADAAAVRPARPSGRRAPRHGARHPPADGPAVAEDDPRRRACRSGAGVPSPAYPVHEPDPTDPLDSPTCAHPEAWSNFAAAAGRRMDGALLYFHLVGGPANHASDGIASLGRDGRGDRPDRGALRGVVRAALLPARGHGRVGGRPPRVPVRGVGSGGATARRCSSPSSTSRATSTGTTSTSTRDAGRLGERRSGRRAPRADDADDAADAGDVQRHAQHALVAVRGQPYQLRRHQAGHHRPGQAAADRVRARLRQRLVPRAVHGAGRQHRHGARHRRDATCSASARGSTAAGSGDDEDWQRWAMFLMSVKGRGARARRPQPVAPAGRAEGARGRRRWRRSCSARDEMANMVWGDRAHHAAAVRRAEERPRGRVPDTRLLRAGAGARPRRSAAAAAAGRGRQDPLPGDELGARELDPDDPGARRRATTARSSSSAAAMLRIMEGDTDPTPEPVRPRTSLLREGPGRRSAGGIQASRGRGVRAPASESHRASSAPEGATAGHGSGSGCASRPAEARAPAAWRSIRSSEPPTCPHVPGQVSGMVRCRLSGA